MTNKILSSDQASQFLCVSKATIYAWVHQKKIPYRKHGHKLAFSEQDLERWSNGNKVDIFSDTNIHPFVQKNLCYTNTSNESSLKIDRMEDGPNLLAKT